MPDEPRTDEPALAFVDADLAKDALHGWAEAQRDLDDRRDPLIRGALAAGVTPTEILTLTKIARSTTARIKESGTSDVAVLHPPTIEYAALLEARAERFINAPDAPRPDTYEGNKLLAFTMTMRNAAKLIASPPEDPSMSEDAWLQLLAARYHRQDIALRYGRSERLRANPRGWLPQDGFEQGQSEAYLVLDIEITRIRRLGQEVFDTLPPDDVAAGRKHLAETNAKLAQE
jgi:hypothetical protein